jgi:hypothetical protein
VTASDRGKELLEEFERTLGPPIASARFLPQEGAYVQAFRVEVPGPPPKQILVGKCLGKVLREEDDAELSQIGQMVIERLIAEKPTRIAIVEIRSREHVLRRAIVGLANAPAGSAVLFVTPDEYVLAQLSYLLGLAEALRDLT